MEQELLNLSQQRDLLVNELDRGYGISRTLKVKQRQEAVEKEIEKAS